MQCEYVNAMVRRSVMQNQSVQVFAHEIVILAAMFSENNVTICKPAGTFRDLDVSEEYERLVRKFGYPNESDSPWVQNVFGRRTEGRLCDAMREGTQLFEQAAEYGKTDIVSMLKSLGIEYDGRKGVSSLEATLRDSVTRQLQEKGVDHEYDDNLLELVAKLK